MTNIVERVVGDLLVRLDRLLCVGFGDCIEAAPALWEFDADGVVTFREPLSEIDRERVIRSCEVCPVDALTVIDASGQVVVG
ncbi:MAG: ferredoxin [Gemmatimonadetes bacterium]|nr:ferredoxin [Gemmatimonadota bacterium]